MKEHRHKWITSVNHPGMELCKDGSCHLYRVRRARDGKWQHWEFIQNKWKEPELVLKEEK